MKKATRRDWEQFLASFSRFQGPGAFYLPQTAAVWFWILAPQAVFVLALSAAFGVRALIPGLILGLITATFGLRWLLVSRHYPDVDIPRAPAVNDRDSH
jgi:hypothetical protein